MSNTVSYSQLTLYAQCPHRWKLDYIDNRRTYEQTIHTIFGSAMHTTIQTYVECALNRTVKEAECMNLHTMLQQAMISEYQKALEKNGNQHFTTKEQLAEFHSDGVAILDYFRKNRKRFFNTKYHELVGIELPLRVGLDNNLSFIGYIDIVVKDKRDDLYTIYDIKTSTQGWNKQQKADGTKTAQLVLYKEFYSQQFNIDPDKIQVEYIIVRRKINDQLEFVPKRIQTHSPASGKVTRKRVKTMLTEFIQTAFNPDGSRNLGAKYPAIKSKACNYCPYKDDNEACPKQTRITRDE